VAYLFVTTDGGKLKFDELLSYFMLKKEEGRKNLPEVIEMFRKYKAEREDFLTSEEDVKDLIQELFIRVLGWDKSDIYKERHPGPTSKRADFQFRDKGSVKLILETKPMSKSWDGNTIKQAIGYGWSSNKEYVVLTNFQRMTLFNAKWKDKNKQIFEIPNIEDCLTSDVQFQNLWYLSKESITTSKLDEFSQSIGKMGKKAEISTVVEHLLGDLKNWRESLIKNIKKLNELSEEDIEKVVQKIINRFIFIRVSEDRDLEVDIKSTLWSHLMEWKENRKDKSLLEHLHTIFDQYDKTYDSSIFRTDELCEDVKISDNILEKIIEQLHTADDVGSEYNFASIDADVLGSVYEGYLSNRNEQGIFYTPTYIVEYIVRNTLGEMLKQKEVEKIKILDPACGSGSFLIKAFDVFSEFYKEKISEEKIDRKIKDSILTNNLYGVDLDPEAVEIAQLNLFLKIGEKGELPNLGGNIKCGNSLIDDEKISKRAFKWEEEFEDKFDIIVGNPPYIRIQTLDKNEVEYFNKNYESPKKNYDIYMLFIEKGFKLLRKGGILGFILPHKFFQGENGENIRKFIHKNKALYKIVDFTTNQIFEDATTYTCLLFLRKEENKEFYYKRFELGEDFENLKNINFEKKDIDILKEDKWNFSDDKAQKILTKIKSQKNKFEDITEKIFKGSSTGDDKIFLLDVIKEDKETTTVFSKKLNQNIELENSLLQPFLYGEDVRRYNPLKSRKLLLFPYTLKDDEIVLITLDVMKKEYPKTFEYLNKLKKELMKRKVKLSNEDFYKYSAARSLYDYKQQKIMIPDMLVSNRISYDEEGKFYHGPAIHSVVFNEKIKEQNKYFYLGILNSKIFWFFITNTSTALRGDTYRLTPEFLSSFCFPEINLKDNESKNHYNNIIQLVSKMISINKRLNEIGNKKTVEREKIEEEIKKTDKEIDEIVYKLYGITEEEKKIIEESLK